MIDRERGDPGSLSAGATPYLRYGSGMSEPDRDPAAPIPDPFARGPSGRAAGASPARGRAWLIVPVLLAGFVGGAVVVGGLARSWLSPPPASASVVTVRSTPNVLIAVRDLSRLETASVHVEKVIDLTDRQTHVFGLVESTDAILLVAVGDAALGVDLSRLGPEDVSMDESTRTARLRLPAPELLHAALDEQATYVHARTTGVLARRNEQLEGQARREAVRAIEQAASTPDMLARAKAQAERQIRALVTQLGAARVEITWQQ